MASILVIEDEPVLARNICASLEYGGHEIASALTGEEGLDAIAKNLPDLVLLDYRLPGMDGLDVLWEMHRQGHSPSVVMMTAHGNIDTAVEAMKRGAGDFLTKPLDLKELRIVIERVLNHRSTSANLSYFRNRERAESELDKLIGDSKPMREVKQFITRITSTPALSSETPPSILISGETGTGKDLIARTIHYAGPRHEAQFVHVNATAMPDHLIESELFGHLKGAFTDARTDKRGLFELAHGGTLFLDEIGHMTLSLQAKLLNVLERRVIRPVGGTKERTVNVHVIAATNRNLEDAIESQEFREDLYHRLRVLSLEMPPLRDRGNDVQTLATHFLSDCAVRYGLSMTGFSEPALALLKEYDWPGNVRELLHTLESAAIIADGPFIRPEHLNIRLTAKGQKIVVDVTGNQNNITIDFAKKPPKLEEIEYQVIKAALEYSQHNLSRAARLLGISRDAIRYRLDKHEKGHGTGA